MQDTNGDSEASDAPRPLPGPGRAKRYALVALAVSGVAVAAWLATRVAFGPVRGTVPGSEPVVPADGTNPVPEPAEGLVNVRVTVKVADARGVESPVGTALPSRLAFKLVGTDGQVYEAGFDRVGVWVMEIPPGEYEAPARQPGMGEWKWRLAGTTVREAGGTCRLKVAPRSAPAVELSLR